MPYQANAGAGVGYRQPTTQFWRSGGSPTNPRTTTYRQPVQGVRRMGDIFSDITTGLNTASNIAGDVQDATSGGGGGYSSPSYYGTPTYAPVATGISPTTLLLIAFAAGGVYLLSRKQR